MPSAELHIQVQILSPRLRFWAGKLTAGAGSENAPVAHLLPASSAIRRGKQSSVLVFLGSLSVSRQAFGGIQRHRRNKSPQNQNKNSDVLPQRHGIQESCPIPVFTPSSAACQRPESQWVVLGNTCKYIHVLSW